MPSLKSENPISPSSPSALKAWVLAARPKTWIASVSPVAIGASMAPQIDWLLFALTLLFALGIQIGTNFANDAFDYLKGADTPQRLGPQRAVQQGWIAPRAMFLGMILAFACALLAAVPLMIQAGKWSLAITAASILFGILYTGGPKPLGYLGMGELLVFPFFGPIAACGAYFLQTGFVSSPVFIASLAPGLFSCNILAINNLRDEMTDRLAKKKTLVVRFGRTFGNWEYAATLAAAALVPIALISFCGAPLLLVLPSLAVLFALPLFRTVFRFQNPRELAPVFQKTTLLFAFYTSLFCLAI